MGLRISRELDIGGQWDLITKLPQNWGTKPCVHQKPGEGAVPPQVTELEFPVSGGSVGQHFGLRPNNREGTQPPPSTENWIKDY